MIQPAIRSLFSVFLVCGLYCAIGGTVKGQLTPDAPPLDAGVGQWTDQLPYSNCFEVLYCPPGDWPNVSNTEDVGFYLARTPYALFQVNLAEGDVWTWSKVNSLSGSIPTAMGWDAARDQIVVGYQDGTVDFIRSNGQRVATLTDIRESGVVGKKAVNSILVFNDRLYAACGFGVVTLHPSEYDVRDTWYVEGQQSLRDVRRVLAVNGQFVVATDAGIFEADIDHVFLASPEAWTLREDVPLEAGDYRDMAIGPGGSLVLHLNVEDDDAPDDQLWIQGGGLWQPLPGWTSDRIEAIASIELPNGDYTLAVGDYNTVRLFDATWAETRVAFTVAGSEIRARGMAFHLGYANGELHFRDVLIADAYAGLLRLNTTDEYYRDQSWIPTGPPYIDARRISAWNDQIWISSGGVSGYWDNMYNKQGVYGRIDGRWEHAFLGEGENDFPGINDVMDIAIDPLDEKHFFAGSWEEGLLEFQSGELTAIHNPTNSTLENAPIAGVSQCAVGGLDFDASGNLWFSNARAEKALHVRLNDGTFLAMDTGGALGSDAWLADVLAARNGYIWAVMPRGQGLFVYDTGGTPSITSDDNWRILTTEEGEGDLPSNDVFSVMEDLDGEIWVGTGSGPCVIYNPLGIFEASEFDDSPIASQVLIQQDGNFQLLLETEAIQGMCIDGANRKWLATQNSGLYLISPDGVDDVAHFSTENSPLMSDNVSAVAINHRTGEVYIATNRGVQVYHGNATNFVQEMTGLHIFPNPIRTEEESATIDGLSFGSTVHVTNASGRVVARLSSEGGRAIWDGRGVDGTPVPTGVYLVLAVGQDGSSATDGKIAVIRP